MFNIIFLIFNSLLTWPEEISPFVGTSAVRLQANDFITQCQHPRFLVSPPLGFTSTTTAQNGRLLANILRAFFCRSRVAWCLLFRDHRDRQDHVDTQKSGPRSTVNRSISSRVSFPLPRQHFIEPYGHRRGPDNGYYAQSTPSSEKKRGSHFFRKWLKMACH